MGGFNGVSGDTRVEVVRVTATTPMLSLLRAMNWRLPVMDHIMMPIVPVHVPLVCKGCLCEVYTLIRNVCVGVCALSLL